MQGRAGESGGSPLRRNRDFVLLQTGQLLSELGSGSTAIVYPLLVLTELGGSPAQAGLVTFMRILPFALFGVLAGVAADRFDRRRVMLTADLVRAVAVGGLLAALALDAVAIWQVLVVGFVEGAGSAFFRPAAAGALRSVVPTAAQLPAAAGVQESRTAVVTIAGPPLGGALFGWRPAAPFIADVVSYACSAVSLVLMRTPFQEARAPAPARLREQLAEGFRFLWREPFLRTTTFLYGLANFIGPGFLLVIVVSGKEEELTSGEIGALLGALGAGILAGSLVAPLLRRRLSSRTILVLELWLWLAPALFLLWPNVYVLAACMLPAHFVIPVTNSVVVGYRLAITPDRVLGRVESVRSTIALLIAPLGPLVAGLLLTAGERLTVAVFVAVGLALALWGTLSRAIRDVPPLGSEGDALRR